MIIFIAFLDLGCAGKMGDLLVKEIDKDQFLTVNSALQSQSLKTLEMSCASCHNVDTVSGGIADVTDVKYLVNSHLIVPGDPKQGRLIGSIDDGKMPSGGPALNSKQISTLKAWIASMTWVTAP